MRWRLRWQRRRRRRDRLSRRDGEPRAILLLSEAVLTLAALLHPAPAPRLNSPSSPSLRQRAASRRRGCAPSASTWRRCASDCVHLALERTRPAFPRRRQLLHHRRQPRRRCPLLLAERSHPSSSCGLLAAANRARAAAGVTRALAARAPPSSRPPPHDASRRCGARMPSASPLSMPSRLSDWPSREPQKPEGWPWPWRRPAAAAAGAGGPALTMHPPIVERPILAPFSLSSTASTVRCGRGRRPHQAEVEVEVEARGPVGGGQAGAGVGHAPGLEAFTPSRTPALRSFRSPSLPTASCCSAAHSAPLRAPPTPRRPCPPMPRLPPPPPPWSHPPSPPARPPPSCTR